MQMHLAIVDKMLQCMLRPYISSVLRMGGASLHNLMGQKSPADGKHGEN